MVSTLTNNFVAISWTTFFPASVCKNDSSEKQAKIRSISDPKLGAMLCHSVGLCRADQEDQNYRQFGTTDQKLVNLTM